MSFSFTLTQFAPLSLTPASLPVGVVGLPYSAQLQVVGGSNFSRSFSFASGSLPAGLFLTGPAIGGTPTASGTGSFTAQVTDVDPTSGTPFSATQSYSWTVNPQFAASTTSLPGASVGVAYSASVAVTGGLPPYSWSLAGGGLPQHLSLDPGTGTISGTPAANTQGNYPLTVKVTDHASEILLIPVTLHVAPVGLGITTSALPPATERVPYNTTLAADGGSIPYSWTATGLPSWLNLSAGGQLSGTPPLGSAGSIPISVKVQDADSQSSVAALSLQVNAVPLAIVTTSSLPEGKEGNPYSGGFLASGGKGPYKWSATGLPNFLSLSQNGDLGGKPPVGSAAVYSFIVTVTDSLRTQTSGTFSLKVLSESSPNPLSVAIALLPPATEQVLYSDTLGANGGTPPYLWAATGLPSWLSLSTAGKLTGTPPAGSAGSYPISVKVQDHDLQSIVVALALQVNASPLTIVTTSLLPDGKEGNPYGGGFDASGGKGPYKWSATGLPGFLTLSPEGTLTGKPGAGSAGAYTFTVTVTDALGNKITGTFSLKVGPQLSITITPPLLQGAEGKAYSATFSVKGGTAPYSWSAIGLPGWANLSPGGLFTGTPPAGSAGSAQFTVTAKDADNNTESTLVTLLILAANGGVTITTPPALPDGIVGGKYQFALNATGGTSPYQWLGSGLPDGLTLSSDGQLSGTPTSFGDFAVTVEATDAGHNVAFAALNLHIAPAPLTIDTRTPLPPGEVSLHYSTIFVSSGGTRPQSWSLVSGALPHGLTFDANGILSGTPTESGTFGFTVSVTEVSARPVPLAKSAGVSARDATATTVSASFEVVIQPYATPDLIVSCGTLPFVSPSQGTATLQTCSVISTIYNSIPFTVSADQPWVNLSTGGITPGRIDISTNAAGLSDGLHEATITVSSPGIAVKTIQVSLANNLGTGILQVSPSKFTLSSPPGAQAFTDSVFVQNIGQGDLDFTVSTDVPWLAVSPNSGTLSAGSSLAIEVTTLATTLSSGGYLGNVQITSANGTVQVPISLLVTKKPKMFLSRDGILQVARQGNGVSGPSPTTFLVWSSNSAEIHYTVEQIGGEGWLTLVSDLTGVATDTAAGKVAFQTKSATLAKGAYYARFRVTAPESFNPVLDFLVVLDVEDASNPPVPDPDPSGLVFAAAIAGSTSPTSQQVTVYTSSDSPLAYQVAVQTENGGPAWLSATPSSGMIATAAPAQLTISVAPGSLPPGVYRGGVNISISNLEVRTVNVTLIVPAASPTPLAVTARAAAPGTCKPANLVLTETGLAGNFSTPAAWPSFIAVRLADDCGNPVLHADVVASFSNGDPPLSLTITDKKMAVYSATWTPEFAASELTITMQAAASGLKSSTTQLVGAVSTTPYPILSQNSTVNNLYPRAGAPLAPGTIVAIYGSALAPSANSANGALPTALAGTSVVIGGKLAPLYYVSANQINAQLPTDLAPNQEYQLLVLANGGYSTPDTIRIEPATPGVARLANGQVVAQHQDFSQVTPQSPAKPGEYLVIYLAGMGLTKTPVVAGTLSPSSPLASVDVPANVSLDGKPVSILFAGLTPGFVGLYQINFQVPSDAKSGTLPLVITQQGVAANNSVLVVGK